MAGEIKKLKITMEVEGREKMVSTLEFTDTTIATVLLQQRAMLEGQLGLVNAQLDGKI